MIFVFGSNLKGYHGKGAAKYARLHHGAVSGVGIGMAGDSYAIPTKNERLYPLDILEVAHHVGKFLQFARENPQMQFKVTPIGTGYAGFTRRQITPLFKYAPANCIFKDEKGNDWRVG